MGMWKRGLEATAAGALVRRPRAGDASGFPVVGRGKSRPRRRSPPGTPPGAYVSNVAGLKSSPEAIAARQSIRLSVAHWGVDAAALGLGDDGRTLLHVGKQQRGDDEAAGVSQGIGMSSRRDLAASQVRHNGEGFSNPSSRASGCRLPLFSD